jgi:glycosyltransferase involved in cell wall biosynthesis
MAAGVPTVASAVGGNRELLADNRGLLVVPANEKALAQAITQLLESPTQRETIAENARRYVHSEYGMPAISQRYTELYNELLARKNWRPSAARTFGADHSDRPLRVMIVAPTLRWVGGQSIQADLLLRNWNGDRDVEAKFLPVDPQLPAPVAWVERIPGLRTMFREPIYLVHLWRGLRNADVAHIFSASYSSFLLAPAPAWLVARSRGKKTLINYHSGEARDHLQRSAIARWILKKTDRLIVPSGYLIDVFREFGLSAQAVPNVADLSQFNFRARDPLRPHLVCTRGFHRYYCVDVVVRAFAGVQAEFPEAQLDLVGKGPEEQAIRQLVAHLKLKNVRFTGVASRQQIGGCYDNADIFINASYLDNMPVSVLEAFTSGTPVVTTSPESMKYLVDHERTGLLSAPGDAGALASNVVRLLRDPELAQRLAANAYQESQHYRWEVVREQWLQVYRSMARPARVPSEDSALRQHDVRE